MNISGLVERHRRLLLITLAAVAYTLGNGAVFFLLPILASRLVDSFVVVGLLIAVPSAVSLFFDIPTGELCERLGWRKIVLYGLLGMVLFAVLLPFASSLWVLVPLLLILGFSNQLINIPIRAFVMEISPAGGTSEYFGVLSTGTQVGFASSALIGGILLAGDFSEGLYSVAILYAAMCMFSIAVIYFGFNARYKSECSILESIKAVARKDVFFLEGLKEYFHLGSAGLIVFALTLFFITADGLIWAMEPLFSEQGIDTETVGLILSMFVIPFIFFQIPGGVLADRLGKIPVLVLGMLLAGCFLIFFGLSTNTDYMIAAAFVSTAGLALAVPATDGLLSDLSKEKRIGDIVGVWDTSEDLGYIVGPIAGGVVAEVFMDVSMPFVFLGAGLILMILPVLLLTRRRVSGGYA